MPLAVSPAISWHAARSNRSSKPTKPTKPTQPAGSSPSGSAGGVTSAALQELKQQQAAVVQRYVGDRINIAERVNATQREILGDKIEAGEAEQARLDALQRRAPGDGPAQQRDSYRPAAAQPQQPSVAPGHQPPTAGPHGGQAPARPYANQPHRPASRPVTPPEEYEDDEGFQGFGGPQKP